jgi:adenylate kinase
MLNLILLGPQGSGKSTQAKLLVEKIGLVHVDMGASLRSIAKSQSDLGRRVNDTINVRKELVSDELVSQILHHVIGGMDSQQGIILDGAPRKETQITSVEKTLADFGRTVDKVIFITLPEEVSIARIASRFACSQCSKSYIIDVSARLTHALICDDCGGTLGQRIDDTPEGVRKRLAVFASETQPVIDHYRSTGKLLTIDGTKSVDDIFEDIMNGLKS